MFYMYDMTKNGTSNTPNYLITNEDYAFLLQV